MAGVEYQARSTDSVTVTIVPGPGEVEFELELNRAEDFASDESIVAAGRPAGANVVSGLPAGTAFFVRGRKVNGGNGPWSDAALVSTAPPAPVVPYVGYSVEPALLVVPEPVDQVLCLEASAGSDPGNLLNDDPMSVLRARAAQVRLIFHTAGRPVDSLSILGTLCSDTATVTIAGGDTYQQVLNGPAPFNVAAAPFRASPGLSERPSYHFFRRLAALQVYPWWKITIQHAAPEFIARNLVIGRARQSVNLSRGARTGFMDLGNVQRNRFGSPDRVRGWRGRMVDFSLSWLNEAEYYAKWSDLDMLVGGTDPVLAIPNTAANTYFHDRIAFGTIEQASAELMRGDKHGKSLEIRSIY